MRGIFNNNSRFQTIQGAARVWRWLASFILIASLSGCTTSADRKETRETSKPQAATASNVATRADGTDAVASGVLPSPELIETLLAGRNPDPRAAAPQEQPKPLTIPGHNPGVTCRIYPLQNQSPSDLADVLNDLLDASDDEDNEADETDESVVIIPDDTARALVVRADQAHQEWIAQMIRRLDTQLQIQIDGTIVEVTKNDEFAWALFDKTGPSSEASPRFYTDKQINALLTDMSSKRYGRVVGKPRLITSNHRTASVETKETTYAKGSSQYYNPYEAGLTLSVTPHVGQTDTIQLDATIASSAYVTTPAPAPPGLVSTKTEVSVTLPTAGTALLGGFRRPADARNGESHLYLLLRAEILRP
jgi:type II secretory pathway component GspD/PulD (secretin)